MALLRLRYAARRVGVPALRRASGSPVSPPSAAPSGWPLAASRSYYNQAGYSKGGDAGWKQESQDIMDRVARHKAEVAANAIMRANRMKKIERRVYMASAAITLCLSWYIIVAVLREAKLIIRERELERKVMQLKELGMLCEVDTEGDENE